MRAILFLLAFLAQPVTASDLKGPTLAAASNFGHWVRPEILKGALALPVRDFRDELFWDLSEPTPGRFAFTKPVTRYPAALPALSLTVNNGHPRFDDGFTPHSAAAIVGFGAHAAAMVQRFPSVHTIEVGNEFNSETFTSGPVRDGPLADRARTYAALLESVYRQVKAVRPQVKIVGGGVHSLPTGYLKPMFEAGALAHMDALAFHPYDTAPEHLLREVAVMRRLPGAETIPLEVTEFGQKDPATAPDFFLRHYCQMALAGVTRAAWYPLHPRGDGFVPLINKAGAPTDMGRAFTFADATFAGRPVQDAAPDPFTYACLIDARHLLIWGAPRALQINRPDLKVLDARGQPLNPPFALSETRVLIVTSDTTLSPETDITLTPQNMLADSFHQYTLPAPGTPDPGPFQRFARQGKTLIPLTTQPGQARPATPWTPYIGAPGQTDARLGAGWLLPVAETEVILRYTAPKAQTVDIDGTWQARTSTDGITVTLLKNGSPLFHATGNGPHHAALASVPLAPGDTLDAVVAPGPTDTGDLTRYRLTLRHAAP